MIKSSHRLTYSKILYFFELFSSPPEQNKKQIQLNQDSINIIISILIIIQKISYFLYFTVSSIIIFFFLDLLI